MNIREVWHGIKRKQISANGIPEILLKSPLNSKLPQNQATTASKPNTLFPSCDRCVRPERGGICAVLQRFPLKSWVWSNSGSVMFLCCGTMSTLEYNIWKTIVSTACTDLCFFLFGRLCSSSNLNVICSNAVEHYLPLL